MKQFDWRRFYQSDWYTLMLTCKQQERIICWLVLLALVEFVAVVVLAVR